jgi:hypothetical protein
MQNNNQVAPSGSASVAPKRVAYRLFGRTWGWKTVVFFIFLIIIAVTGLLGASMYMDVKLLANCYATNTKGVTSAKQLELPYPLMLYPKVTGANAVCWATVGVGFYNCTDVVTEGEKSTRADCKLKELIPTDEFNDKFCDLPGIGKNSTYCSKMKDYTHSLRAGLAVGIVSAIFCGIGILFAAWAIVCLIHALYRFCNPACRCTFCCGPALKKHDSWVLAFKTLIASGSSNAVTIPFAMLASIFAFAAAGVVSSADFKGILPDTSTLRQGNNNYGIIAGVLLSISMLLAVFVPSFLTSKRCTADLMADALPADTATAPIAHRSPGDV